MRIVYAGGIISGLTFKEASDWREEVQKKLGLYGIMVASPLRGKEHLEDETVLHKAGFSRNPMTTQKGITTRDRFDVMKADIVLMNLLGAKEVSIGCMIECGYGDILRKPIVCVMEKGNPHDGHAMLETIISYKVDTLDKAIEIIRKILCYEF